MNKHEELLSTLRDLQRAIRIGAQNDVADVLSVLEIRNDAMSVAQQRKELLEQTVQELSETVERKERLVRNNMSGEEFRRKLKALEEEQKETLKMIESKKGVKSDIESRLERIKTELRELQLVEERRKHEADVDIPRDKHMINLYYHITNIQWDYASKDRVRGFVLPSSRSESGRIAPIPFDFDPRTTPDYQITNSIWDMLA